MSLHPGIKNNWITLQKQYTYPVNTLGRRIAITNQRALAVWEKEGISEHIMSSQIAEHTASSINQPLTNDLILLMADFIRLLIEELGSKGFGQQNLLRIVKYRLLRLGGKYPHMRIVTLKRGSIDFSKLHPNSAEPNQMLAAWSELVNEIYKSGVDNLGLKNTEQKYRRVYDTLYSQKQSVFNQFHLNTVLQ